MKERHKLTIYLLKESLKDFTSCLKKGMTEKLTPFDLKPELEADGIIYIATTTAKEPKWKSLLEQGTSSHLPDLKNSSNKAIL